MRKNSHSPGGDNNMDAVRSAAGALGLTGDALGRRRTRGRKIDRSEASAAAHRQLLWLIAVAAGSGSILAVEFLHPVAHAAPTLRATVETVITLCALTGGWLLHAQFRRTRKLRDLILMGTFLSLALLDLSSYALPASLGLHAGRNFAAAVIFGSLFVAGMFVAAARTPPESQLRSQGRPEATVVALSVGAIALAQLGGLLMQTQLAVARNHPLVGTAVATGKPLAVIGVLIASGLFLYAMLVFARRERIERTGVNILLAGALILLAVARLYYLAMPVHAPGWIDTREALRLLGLVLVMAAAVQQELKVRGDLARAAALTERRRLARDLHDGLAQDLAFIAAHGAQISGPSGEEHPVAIAARRALAISRGMISELSDCENTSSHDALEALAFELGNRFGIVIGIDSPCEAELAPHQRDDVLRIVREAIANAVRHGGARSISVALRRSPEGVVVRIRDDGRGIAQATPGAYREGFGLRSMRERASALGGYLTVRERTRGGTELEVVMP